MKSDKNYTIEQAIDFVKKNCKAKFDSTIEVHINLNLDKNKQEQSIRFTTTLPHGTGKTKKVAVFASEDIPEADLELTESDLNKIQKGELTPKVDFDILIAEPQYMAKIARVAKILGPAGVMPNPKAGTVTKDVKKTVEQVRQGRLEVRTEPNANIIHTIIGKRSFDTLKLKENFEEVINALTQNKPAKAKPDWIKTCFISATMSPAAQVEIGA